MAKKMELLKYEEPKPHAFKRMVWRVVNAFIFPLLAREARARLVRLFGAKLEPHVLLFRSVRIFAPWNLECGTEVCFGPRTEVFCKGKIVIGSGVIISQDSYLCTGTHDYRSPKFTPVTRPITIGDNCWLAAKVSVMPGVTIGEGTVVGACAVVTKDLPPWSVAVGNPCRVVGKRELDHV